MDYLDEFRDKSKRIEEMNEKLLLESSDPCSSDSDDSDGGAGAATRRRRRKRRGRGSSSSDDSDSDESGNNSDGGGDGSGANKKRKTSGSNGLNNVSVVEISSSSSEGHGGSDGEGVLDDVVLDPRDQARLDHEEAVRKFQHAKRLREQRMYTRVTGGSGGAAAAAAASSSYSSSSSSPIPADTSIDELEAARIAEEIARRRDEQQKSELDEALVFIPINFKEQAKEALKKETGHGGNSDAQGGGAGGAGGAKCVNFTVVAKDKQDKKVFPLDIEAGLQLLVERVAEWQGVPVSKIKLWFPAECDFVSLMDMVEDIGDAGDEVTFELR